MSDNRRFESVDLGSTNFSLVDLPNIDTEELEDYLMADPLPEKPASTQTEPKNDNTNTQNKAGKTTQPPAQENGKPSEELIQSFLSKDEHPAEEEQEQPVKPAKTNTAPADDNDEDNIYSVLNADLLKAGIFSADTSETPVTNAESFKERFLQEMHRGANSILDQFLSQHGEDYREAFQAIFVNGVSPAKYFTLSEQLLDLEGMDLSREDNQEKVLRSFYKSKGFSAEKTDAKIAKIKDYGDLEDDAKQVHEVLLNEQKKRIEDEKQSAEEETIRRQQNKINYQNNIQKILQEKAIAKSFDGLPLNSEHAQKIYAYLTADAYRLPNARVITEFEKDIMELDRPENFEKKIKLAMLLENGFDFSAIKRTAVNEESNELFEGLMRKKKKKQLTTPSDLPAYF